MAQNVNRRAERAKRAKDTVNKVIPDMLRSSPRARHGIHKADLVVDPEISTKHGDLPISSFTASGPKIRLLCTDTLDAASRISDRPFTTRRAANNLKTPRYRPNVAILSFASPLKPGGGFLEGANSQEEFLCARSTLYPSLWDSFYRLPEVGGIYTPDVMVFRDSTPEANELIKRDRFFVDVISAGMLRFPETRGRSDEKLEHGCSCGVSYCDRDREFVARKMKAVMRIAQQKGAERIVLGAWGCGAYGNPVKEVAKIWRKVLVGSLRQRRPNAERWQGIKEVVFAIPDRNMAHEFELAFKDVLSTDAPSRSLSEDDVEAGAEPPVGNEDGEIAELVTKIQETELQIEMVQSIRSKHRLRDVLSALNRDLAQSLAAGRNKDEAEDTLPPPAADEEVDEDFIAINHIPGSDVEDPNETYHFSSSCASGTTSPAPVPEAYEFRPAPPGLDFETSMDEDELDLHEGGTTGPGSSTYSLLLQPSPNYDPKTGWFNGSIDQLQGLLRGKGARSISRASPELRPEGAGEGIEDLVLG